MTGTPPHGAKYPAAMKMVHQKVEARFGNDQTIWRAFKRKHKPYKAHANHRHIFLT